MEHVNVWLKLAIITSHDSISIAKDPPKSSSLLPRFGFNAKDKNLAQLFRERPTAAQQRPTSYMAHQAQ